MVTNSHKTKMHVFLRIKLSYPTLRILVFCNYIFGMMTIYGVCLHYLKISLVKTAHQHDKQPVYSKDGYTMSADTYLQTYRLGCPSPNPLLVQPSHQAGNLSQTTSFLLTSSPSVFWSRQQTDKPLNQLLRHKLSRCISYHSNNKKGIYLPVSSDASWL